MIRIKFYVAAKIRNSRAKTTRNLTFKALPQQHKAILSILQNSYALCSSWDVHNITLPVSDLKVEINVFDLFL